MCKNVNVLGAGVHSSDYSDYIASPGAAGKVEELLCLLNSPDGW